MTYLKTGGMWLLQVLMAVVMTGSGIQKFTRPAWERMFRVWGYPDGFYLVIGSVEAICGIGLLIPETASYSAITLALIMVGAAATQILRGGRNGVGELVFASLLTLVAVLRWRDRLRLAASSQSPAAVS